MKNTVPTLASSEPPLDDPVYRTVMAMRGSEMLEARPPGVRSGRTVFLRTRVVQTHYKPFARARLLAEVWKVDALAEIPRKQLLYIHVYKSAREMHEEYERATGAADRPLLIVDKCALAWSLVDAPGLETLRFCFELEQFAQFLVDHDLGYVQTDMPALIRYVPRKRALFRSNAVPRLYIKCYEPERDEPAANNLRLLWQGERLRFDAPRLLAHDTRRRALVMSEVQGSPLTTLMSDASPQIFARVGAAIADLHGRDLAPAGSWTPQRLFGALLKAMGDVHLALPAVSERLQEVVLKIAARMKRLSFDRQAPIHGNLFGDQILIGADRVGIVDWDDLGVGDPLYDLGRLLAHFIYVCRHNQTAPTQTAGLIDAMLKRYVEETGRRMDWDRLRWQIAAALLMRAKISALRMLPVGWTDDIASAIVEADRVLAGEGQWLAG